MFQNIEIMGYTVSLYDFWNAVSAVALFAYLISQTKPFSKISPYAANQPSEKRKIMVAFGEVLATMIVIFVLFRIFNPVFAKWFTRGNANYYGSLTAWFLAITVLTIIFKTSLLQMHDMFAPALPIQLLFAKLACFFHGCCSGYEMPESWYFNHNTDRYEFPVQLLEAVVAFGLFVFLRWYQKRSRIPGSVFPVYLVLYAVSRFGTEFLRGDLPSVFGILNAYQVLSVVYVLLGGVLLGAVWMYHRVSARRREAS